MAASVTYPCIDLWRALDEVPFRVSVKDRNHRFVYMNRCSSAVRGIADPSSVAGTSDTDYFVGPQAAATRADEAALLAGGPAIQDRLDLENWKDGTIGWVRTTKFLTHCTLTGEPLIVCFVKDSDDTSLLRQALSVSQLGIWYRVLDSKVTWFSGEWKRMLGYEPEEFPNDYNLWLARVHPEDAERVRAALADYLERRVAAYLCEYRLRHKDGSYRSIRARGVATWDSHGKPIVFAGSHEDTTGMAEKDALLRQAFDGFPGAVFVKDDQFRLRYVNRRFTEMVGMPEDELLDHTDFELPINREDADKFRDDDHLVLSENRTVRNSHERLTVQGRVLDLETTKTRIMGTVTTGPCVLGFAIDSGDLHRTTRELQGARDAFQRVVDSVPEAIFFFDSDRRLTRANRRFAELVNASEVNSLIGKRTRELVGFSSLLNPREVAVVLKGTPVRAVARQIGRESMLKYVNISVVPLFGEGNVVTEVCGIVQDVTDLVRWQKKDEQYSIFMDTILNRIPQCVFVKDRDGFYQKCNTGFAERHGFRHAKDIEGKTDDEFWPTDVAEKYREDDRRVIDSGLPMTNFREEQIVDGKRRIIETSKFAMPDIVSNKRLVVGIYQDITGLVDGERIPFYREVAKSISHCLKNWLLVIDGSVTELESVCPELTSEAVFERLKKATAFLREATILATNITRLDSGLKKEPFQIREVIEEALSTLNDPRLHVKFSTLAECNGLKVHFRNAVLELVSNALRYVLPLSNGGRVDVALTRGSNETCQVTVTDNGEGIPDHLREKLYNHGSGGDAARNGLGLSYSKTVCELCGGELSLDEDYKGGTRFVMSLPVASDPVVLPII